MTWHEHDLKVARRLETEGRLLLGEEIGQPPGRTRDSRADRYRHSRNVTIVDFGEATVDEERGTRWRVQVAALIKGATGPDSEFSKALDEISAEPSQSNVRRALGILTGVLDYLA